MREAYKPLGSSDRVAGLGSLDSASDCQLHCRGEMCHSGSDLLIGQCDMRRRMTAKRVHGHVHVAVVPPLVPVAPGPPDKPVFT